MKNANTEVTTSNNQGSDNLPVKTYAAFTGVTSIALLISGFLSTDAHAEDFLTYRDDVMRGHLKNLPLNHPDRKDSLEKVIEDFRKYKRENIKPSQERLAARKTMDKFTVVCAILLGAELLGGLLWQKIAEKKADNFTNRIEKEKSAAAASPSAPSR